MRLIVPDSPRLAKKARADLTDDDVLRLEVNQLTKE